MNFPQSTPPNELYVVGEREGNPTEFLLRGVDGQYYAYQPPNEELKPVDPSIDPAWRVEGSMPSDLELELD
jgi:hypothetical protein